MPTAPRAISSLVRLLFLACAAVLLLRPAVGAQGEVTAPEKHFGFRLGSDRQIARWDKIVDYFKLLQKQGGGKLKVVNMGPATMGQPFLLVIVSSPDNMAKLDRLRQVNLKISDPRGVAEQEVKKLVGEGRAVICQTMSLHATEIGGTQMAPELAYDLLARADDETRRILDNVVFLLVPCFNPDGQVMVADWYQKYLGTKYEGAPLPWLYHKYVGHDNNRDAFQTNMVESQYMAKILFTDWIPQAYIDHHQMGSYGARIYVPPYAEPVRPLADPLVWREHSWYGAHIAYKEEEANLSGVLNAAQYSGWGHFGFHWITPFHNIAGMLTECASTRLASPIFIHPEQLRGSTRGLPDYEQQTTFPSPWLGGWWRLRDIVDRQKVSAWAMLDLAARNRETVLWNAYLKAQRQTERGAQSKPAAYVISGHQHDPLTAVKMVNKLLVQGIEIRQAARPLVGSNGVTYPAGSFLVSLAQPKMGLIRYLLGRTFYPDNSYTRDKEGAPIRPYDMATDSMFEFMGVRVDPLDAMPQGDLPKLSAPVPNTGKVAQASRGYVLDGRQNDSFWAVNLLLDKKIAVRRVDKPSAGLCPGDFLIGTGSEPVLQEIAQQTGVTFADLKIPPKAKSDSHEVKRLRVAMYQRYRGGNMDEGWTRFLLEQFAFPYTSLMDAEMKGQRASPKSSADKQAKESSAASQAASKPVDLKQKYDVIILPSDSTGAIVGEQGAAASRADEMTPPEYRSGMGKEGVAALKAFVQKGGTLVALGAATGLAIDKFSLPVRNVLANKPAKEFFCPGSTLRVTFDNTHPLAYGMPAEGLVVFMYSPAFEITPSEFNERYQTVVRYADRDLLESGWLIGESSLAKKCALVSAQVDKGRVILIGFRAQHRAQTHATYKLLFNTLLP